MLGQFVLPGHALQPPPLARKANIVVTVQERLGPPSSDVTRWVATAREWLQFPMHTRVACISIMYCITFVRISAVYPYLMEQSQGRQNALESCVSLTKEPSVNQQKSIGFSIIPAPILNHQNKFISYYSAYETASWNIEGLYHNDTRINGFETLREER